jgi:hypothetical protein
MEKNADKVGCLVVTVAGLPSLFSAESLWPMVRALFFV